MAHLSAAEQLVRVDVVKAVLGAGLRVADLAVTLWSLGNAQAASRAELYARRAYADFMRLLPAAEDAFNVSDSAEIGSKRTELDELLARMWRERFG